MHCIGLSWYEDDDLGYLLPQLLEKNELSKVYGEAAMKNDHFNAGIKRLIPIGHTFKYALPLMPLTIAEDIQFVFPRIVV